jgi:secondary thiamine-phosphate synthase enzyme
MLEISTKELKVQTKGFTDIINITPHLEKSLKETEFFEGQLTLFVSGSTAALTTMEFEPGLLKDLPIFFESILPQNKKYEHDYTWHDGNGYAHLRSALIKTNYTIPFHHGKLLLGTWQQVVLIDFDNRPRQRNIILQFLGAKK